jgi:hypothetical protein
MSVKNQFGLDGFHITSTSYIYGYWLPIEKHNGTKKSTDSNIGETSAFSYIRYDVASSGSNDFPGKDYKWHMHDIVH